MKPRVVVVGSFVQDLAFFTRDFPRPGETVVGDFRPGPGGKGFNQAVAAMRAGTPTLFIGAIGRDAFGAGARQFAHREGMRSILAEKKKEPTGAAIIAINAAGQNQIVVALGANLALHKRDVPPAALQGAEVVVTQAESDMDTTVHALKLGRRAGAITVFNPAPMRADLDLGVLRHTEVLIPNETEFFALVRRVPASAALLRSAAFREHGDLTADNFTSLKADLLHRLCRSLNVPIVIVTLGSKGCFVSQPDVYVRIQAHDVDAIDSTGAGDAFVGGLAAGLVKYKRNVFEAAHFANAVAALSVTRPGTAPSMPTAREIARFLRKRDHA
ncbi:MAG TPA: ribokinase [Candidatus Didemnitutus sp.]|nr:ribokinase [Candidatus Didemnitutus sp.]